MIGEREFRALFLDGQRVSLQPGLSSSTDDDVSDWWVGDMNIQCRELVKLREAWDYYRSDELTAELPRVQVLVAWAFHEGATRINEAVDRAKNLRAHEMPGLRYGGTE